MKRIFRLLFAFVVSGIVLFAAYYSFWWYAMSSAEKTLQQKLESAWGGTASYQAVQWLGKPTKIAFLVQNLSFTFHSEENDSYTFYLGDVQVTADFMGDVSVEMVLPEVQHVVVQGVGAQKKYNVRMEEGKIAYFPNRQNGEAVFSLKSLSVHQAQPSGDGLLVLQTGHLKLTRNMAQSKGAVAFAGRDIKIYPPTPTAANDFDLFALNADIYNGKFAKAAHLLAALQGRKAAYNVVAHMAKQAADEQSFLQVHNFRVKRGDMWLTATGRVAVDHRQRPEVELAVNTNQSPDLIRYLGNRQLIDEKMFSGNPAFKNLFQVGQSVNLDFVIKEGDFAINGVSCGVVNPMAQVVQQLS